MSARVAVLGTGKMGSALAARLSDGGYDLTLWNRTRSRAEQLHLGRVARTPAEAVAAADVVITSLTDADAVRATFAGPSGALAAASAQRFIEMSTAGPYVATELHQDVASKSSSIIDAPVVGVPAAVRNHAALIIAGGERAEVESVRDILELFGEMWHVGPLGSGARLKLVANSMLGATTTAAAELQVGGTAAGLDAEIVFKILLRFVPSLNARREGYLHDQHEPTLFALRDLRKDLNLALDMYSNLDIRTPLTALVREIVEGAASESPDLDISAVIQRYES